MKCRAVPVIRRVLYKGGKPIKRLWMKGELRRKIFSEFYHPDRRY